MKLRRCLALGALVGALVLASWPSQAAAAGGRRRLHQALPACPIDPTSTSLDFKPVAAACGGSGGPSDPAFLPKTASDACSCQVDDVGGAAKRVDSHRQPLRSLCHAHPAHSFVTQHLHMIVALSWCMDQHRVPPCACTDTSIQPPCGWAADAVAARGGR